MRRKLIKQGGGGYTFYVPKKWIDSHGLKAGDEIEIEESKDNLILSSSKTIKDRKIEIKIEDMDINAFFKSVTAAYESGFDEILIAGKKNIFNPKLKKKVDSDALLEKLAQRLIGFEIISKKDRTTILKEVSSPSIGEFETVFRRTILLILEFFETKSRQETKQEDHLFYHDNISKLISFCSRLLTKNVNKDNVEVNAYNIILSVLDNITDSIRDARIKDNISKERIGLVGEYFREYYDLLYKYNNHRINDIDKKRIELLSIKNLDPDLRSIVNRIHYLIKPTIVMHLS